MTRRFRIITVLTVLLLSVGCDQAVKHVAEAVLRDAVPVSFLHDFIRLQYAENPGIMLSIGAALSPVARFWIFVVGVGLLLAGMLAYVLWSRELDRMQMVTWSLILAGGFGNLLDRMTKNGVVIDYISVGVGVVRTAVFNIADALVFVGVFLLIIHGTKKGAGPAGGQGQDKDQADITQEKLP